MILPDVLRPGLDVVLCGTAPSRASKEALAYYAHPGNIFWRTLWQVGLTPCQLSPTQYPEVLRYGIGLTDLNKTEWGADSDLSGAGFDVAGFVEKMGRFRPGAIAFDSKCAARCFFATLHGRRRIAYGRQAESLHGAALFVVPSPSGRARGYFDLAPWRDLAAWLGRTPGEMPPLDRPLECN